MNLIAAQQIALDNALVSPDHHVKIGKCNMRIDTTKTQKEPTYQVVLDALALSPLYPTFLITAEVLEIYMHQCETLLPIRLAFATGATTPRKARKFKKPVPSSKKKILIAVEEPAKKLDARRQSAGVQIRDTPGVFVSKKKAPAKAERSKGIELLSEVALLEEAQLKKAIKRTNKKQTFIK
ncbi:hypothetical protein Tco_0477175 [Tanacetum coccineum]